MKFYAFLYKTLASFFRFVFQIHVHGEENIPEDGGLLVCPNHISAMDVIMLSVAMKKRQVRYMAKAELFKMPVLKQLITCLGAFPINRGAGDVAAIRKTIKLLKEGQTVGMFPQGTRYTGVHPRNSSVKSGAGMMAHRANVPVLPVAIITKGYRVRIFKRVDIVFGKAMMPEELGFVTGNHAEQQAASDRIFEEMLKLHDRGTDNGN